MRSTVVLVFQAGPSSEFILVHSLLSYLQHPNELVSFQHTNHNMHFSTIFAATAFVGAAVAEQHFITVANRTGGLVFTPDSLQAAQGDTVTFRFWPKNHSVAQSTFAQPCAPMNNGFWSGYVPTTSAESVANWTFTYEVTNASAPVWFYCTQGRHCQSGMVGVINPP